MSAPTRIGACRVCARAPRVLERHSGVCTVCVTTKLVGINLDIPRAVAVVLGAEPRVRTLLLTIEAALKSPPTGVIESLRQMALGAWYAHLVAMPVKSEGSAKELLERATPLRSKLLKAADALAHARPMTPSRRTSSPCSGCHA